jgi:putative membrane protein
VGLTPEDSASVERAVAQAEQRTRGEICCVITEEASVYPDVPLVWGAAAALAAPLVLAALGLDPLRRHWSLGGWEIGQFAAANMEARTALVLLAALQVLIFFAVAFIVSHAPVRRALTPRWVRRERVHRRATEQFAARGLDRTRERTGVLLFVSLKDRIAVVIADEGINAKVEPDAWEQAIKALIAKMSEGKLGEGLIAAISRCGDLLAAQFPASSDNPNELPDAPVQV